jgi:hypothetical protein
MIAYIARRNTETQLLSKGILVAAELVVQLPCAATEANDGFSLAGHPEVVVEGGAGVRYLRTYINTAYVDMIILSFLPSIHYFY